MTIADPTQAVVRFVKEVDALARSELIASLERSGVAARMGLDLGDRDPKGNATPTLVITILSDIGAESTGDIAGISIDARDWLASHAKRGTDPRLEVELRANGAAAVVRIDSPTYALQKLGDLLPTVSAAAPIAWDGQCWTDAATAPERTATNAKRSVKRARSPHILALDTEWYSARGGLSTFNRQLCTALVDAGAEVCCTVLNATPHELTHASSVNVMLLSSRPLPGGTGREPLMQRPQLPGGWEPDLVIGHGRITGPYAKSLVENHFPAAKRIHIVHQVSDEVEWLRPWKTQAGEDAERNTAIEIELARGAFKTLGVGPRLHGLVERELSAFNLASQAGRIDPGFDTSDTSLRMPPPGSPKQVMVMGRLDDWQAKGLDLAAKVVGKAIQLLPTTPEVELLLRGVPPGEHAKLREMVSGWAAARSLRVTPRSYSSDAMHIQLDLRKASLFLTPARAEAFGLVGLEAIVAGTPALISGKSGLGMLLREVLKEEADLLVLPIDNEEADLLKWAAATAAVLRDPVAAFGNAAHIRKTMAGKVTWAGAAKVVLDILETQ